MRTTTHRPIVMAAVLAALATAGCSLTIERSSGPPHQDISSAITTDGAAVTVTDNEFAPDAIEVDVGDNVTWTWQGGTHDVVFDDGGSDIQRSGTWNRVFESPGSYPYRCTLHNGMAGTVIVREPA